MFRRQTRAGINLWQAEPWASWDVMHAFSDKHGGVSRGPFRSLNLGFHVGDESDRVRENRRRLCEALSIDLDALVVGEQVHGHVVAHVTATDRGRGARDLSDVVSGADALITNTPNVILFGLFADCVPIFLFDPEKRAVGLAHAGWKGTAGHIAARTVKALIDTFGSRPADCFAAIGPSIGPCCYEVGVEVAARFRDEDFAFVTTKESDRVRLNLWAANERQLVEVGISPARISVARLCTRCLGDTFFSHRGQNGRTGRMAAIIGLGHSGRT